MNGGHSHRNRKYDKTTLVQFQDVCALEPPKLTNVFRAKYALMSDCGQGSAIIRGLSISWEPSVHFSNINCSRLCHLFIFSMCNDRHDPYQEISLCLRDSLFVLNVDRHHTTDGGRLWRWHSTTRRFLSEQSNAEEQWGSVSTPVAAHFFLRMHAMVSV